MGWADKTIKVNFLFGLGPKKDEIIGIHKYLDFKERKGN